MTSMNMTTEENKSSRKKIFIVVSVIVIVAIIALVVAELHFSTPFSAPSPYVEVKYRIVGAYNAYPLSDNNTCLVLNLTVTNKGYTDEVWVLGYPNFSLNISNVVYKAIPTGNTPISDGLLGYHYLYFNTLPQAFLMNNESATGTIMFKFPKQLNNSPFTLQCSMTTLKDQTVNVKISIG
jgi:hypothetical protein